MIAAFRKGHLRAAAPSTWPWWLLGGSIALAFALTAALLLLRRRAKAKFDGLFGPGAT